jgi:Ca-activated chloride channel family protein
MLSFLDQAPDSLRIGVMSFSDQPAVNVAPTTDHEALAKGIDLLRPGLGTALGDGIARAVALARAATGTPDEAGETLARPARDAQGRALASILLLSDGAQTRGILTPGQGAERAHAAGIPVDTITLGTDSGTILTGPPGEEHAVPMPPDRQTLAAIAEYTDGESFNAESAAEAKRVYAGLGSRVGREDRPREVTAMFVAVGALLLASAAGLALPGAPRLP